VLLFRFVFKNGALAGQDYWATPGGAIEGEETFAEAARRELFEETGIMVGDVGKSVAKSEFVLQLVTGEKVIAEEQFFKVRVVRPTLSNEHWNALEKEVMVEHRWWTAEELKATSAVFFPKNLLEML
jgi:8-oxo-dGTP pyrophosphatase MutT (NUDIX family)